MNSLRNFEDLLAYHFIWIRGDACRRGHPIDHIVRLNWKNGDHGMHYKEGFDLTPTFSS
jgi:hypothetical protein